jgi:hypothetical protein
MAYYLKWPSDTGTAAGNDKLCQLSGIATTGNVNIALVFAEDVVDPSTTSTKSAFIYDGRRTLNSTTAGSGGYFLESNNAININATSNYNLNGSTSTNTGWRTALAGDTYSFDSGTQADGVIAVGARYSQTESFPLLALRSIIITDNNGTHTVDMSSSGGTANTFTSTDGVVTLTLFGFTGTSHWVFYSSGSTAFTGTIGKTTLTPTTQSLSINTGLVLSSGLSTLTPSNKQLGVVAGVSLGVGKQVLTLNTKPEFVQAGAVVTNGKQAYPLATKQLSVVVGANVPFIATINKSSYSLSGKQLAIQAGWNSSILKDSLSVQNKQEGVNAGALFNINEQQLTLSKKGLSLVTGTSISFVGELNKADLNATGKPLSVVAGTSIPFTGLIQKTSLTLSGKALTHTNGHILEIQKQSLNLVNKQLSVGETIYPIIPIERLFTIKDGDRVYLMKQTTTIYIMKNN